MSRATFVKSIMPPETPKTLLRQIAQAHGMKPAHILGTNRQARFVRARWAWWAECRKLGLSLPAIAAKGNWHHTSVMHGIKQHEEMREGRKDG